MKKWIHGGLAVAMALSLSGCFKSEAPKCSDPQVVKLVEQLYAQQIEDLKKNNPLAAMFITAMPQKMVRIDSARPVKYDENVKLRSCKGEAVFDDNRTANIEYTVQLDEKNHDQFYVELKMDFIQGLAQQGMMEMMMKDIKK